jgi:(p)ppGpp synthase/HD superfamily hydrolase
VEVTRILAELKMDYESLIAGLLHDTVEDTEAVSFEEIEVRKVLWMNVDRQTEFSAKSHGQHEQLEEIEVQVCRGWRGSLAAHHREWTQRLFS